MREHRLVIAEREERADAPSLAPFARDLDRQLNERLQYFGIVLDYLAKDALKHGAFSNGSWSGYRVAVNFHFLRLDARRLGLRQAAREVRPGPEDRSRRAEHARYGPDHTRAVGLRRDPGAHHRHHHHRPRQRFERREHTPAELVRDMLELLRKV